MSKKETYANMRWILRIFFVVVAYSNSNVRNDDIISYRSALKMSVNNPIFFWSKMGSEFGERGTTPTKIPRSTPGFL